jgi:23S rRNA pseudouridine2605 synthase
MVYIALHKPRGFLVSNADPEGRPLAQQLFRGAIKERLFHVGRLDFLSSGLILYTNDGEFSRIVAHPRAQIEKEYLVESPRVIEEELLRRYARGIRVGEETYRCKAYVLRGPHSATVTLTEGKNREIRNVFASRNLRLKRVHRLRIGPVTLRGIQPGHFRRLTEREVRWFYEHGTT